MPDLGTEFVQRLETHAKSLYYPGIGFLDWAEGMVKEFGVVVLAPLTSLWKKIGGLSTIKPAKNYLEAVTRLRELQSKRRELNQIKNNLSHFDWRTRAIVKMFELIADESLSLISIPVEEQATVVLFHSSVSDQMEWKIGRGAEIVRKLVSSKLGEFFLNVQITSN